MLGNREIMAANIKRFMELKEVTASDVCQALGFKHNTFSYWVNAKMYPRIDKIEMMASYFGCSKADLVEDHNKDSRTMYALEQQDRRAAFPEIDFAIIDKLVEAYIEADPSTQKAIRIMLKVED